MVFKITFLAIGIATLMVYAVALTVDDNIGNSLSGPDPFTYQYGDNIAFVCETSNYYPYFKWTQFDDYNRVKEISHLHLKEYGNRSEIQFTLDHKNYPNIRCEQTTFEEEPVTTLEFRLQPATRPKVLQFNAYNQHGRSPVIVCMASQNQPNISLALYKFNRFYARQEFITHNTSNQNAIKLTMAFHPFEEWFGNYTCEASNSIGRDTKYLEIVKKTVTLGKKCASDKECHEVANSICFNRRCRCNHGTAERNFNHKEECVPGKKLYEKCEYHDQCQLNDVNTFCDWGYCKCTKFHEDLDGKCNRRLWINDYCTSDDECQVSVANSECNIRHGTGHCACQVGFWYSHGRCVSHRFFANSRFLRVSGIMCMVGLVLLLISLTFFTCRSARLILLRKKGEHYRNLVLSNQTLSLSRNVPMKAKHGPDVKPPPSLPVNHEANVQRMNSSNEDPTICVSESIPFIKRHHDSVC